MEEFKNIIRNAPNDKLYALLTIYNELFRQIPSNSPAQRVFQQMIECIEVEIKNRGLSNNRGFVSDSMKREAFDYLKSNGINIENNINRYEREEKKNFFDGFIGFCVFFGIIVVIAIIKMFVDGVVTLWNNGVLKIVLGLITAGSIIFVSYKKGLFEKIKGKVKNNRKTIKNVKSNTNSKEKVKEIVKDTGVVVKGVIKNLTIYSSVAAILGTGMAHLDKHTDVLDETFLKDIAENCHCVYDDVTRLIREKKFECITGYGKLERNGYMEYINPQYSKNINDFNYDDYDVHFFLNSDFTWDEISNYAYDTPIYANHLRLYNARYNFEEDKVYKNEEVLIPNVEKLEEYVASKRLIKK